MKNKICKCCGNLIERRAKNSKYCKNCARHIINIKNKLTARLYARIERGIKVLEGKIRFRRER